MHTNSDTEDGYNSFDEELLIEELNQWRDEARAARAAIAAYTDGPLVDWCVDEALMRKYVTIRDENIRGGKV